MDFGYKRADFGIMKRLAARSFVLIMMTCIGLMLLNWITYLGASQISSINTQIPELIPLLRGALILSWAEMSILWIRTTVQPGVDVQAPAKSVMVTEGTGQNAMAASVLYGVHQLGWLARLLVLLKLCDFI